MPLPSFSREVPKIPKASEGLFKFSIALLVIVVLAYGVFWFFGTQADKDKASFVKQNDDLKIEIDPLKTEVQTYGQKIEAFNLIFQNHIYNSNFFSFFESITHPKVWFSKFSLTARDGKISISGNTDDFESMGQQLMLYGENESVKSLNLSNISFGKDGREFNFTLLVDPKIFKKQ